MHVSKNRTPWNTRCKNYWSQWELPCVELHLSIQCQVILRLVQETKMSLQSEMSIKMPHPHSA